MDLEIQKCNLGTTVEVAFLNLQIQNLNLCVEYMNCNLRGLKSESQDSNLRGQDSVGYEHRSLENPLGSLENLPARRALVLEMLEKNFARFSLGSVCARKKFRSSSLGSIFLCSKCSKCARYRTQKSIILDEVFIVCSEYFFKIVHGHSCST